MKSVRDARLKIMKRFEEFFFFFSDIEDDTPAAVVEEIREDAQFKAELMMGATGMEVVSVDNGIATVTMSLPDFEQWVTSAANEFGDEE